MMNHLQMLINRLPWQRLLALCLILVLISVISSCRDKSNNIFGPTPNPTGAWVIYLSNDGVHVGSTNDTISVRVYSPEGVLSGGVSVRAEKSSSSENLHVTSHSVNTTTDTVGFPWGTTVPVVYWGIDTLFQVDTVICAAFVSGVEVADTFTIINLISDF